MKRLYYIATLAIALFASLPIQAQEEAGNTQQQQQRRRGPEASRGAREAVSYTHLTLPTILRV